MVAVLDLTSEFQKVSFLYSLTLLCWLGMYNIENRRLTCLMGCHLVLVISNGAQEVGEGRYQLPLKASERESKYITFGK